MDLLTLLLEAMSSPDHPTGDDAAQALQQHLADAGGDALDETRVAALERFDSLFDADGTPSDDDLATMEHLAVVLDAVTLEQTARAQAASDARERAAGIAERVGAARPRPDDDEDDTGDDEPDPAPRGEVVEGEPVPALTAAAPARRTQMALGGINRDRPPARREATRMELVAAADVPGFPTGAPLHDMGSLVRAVENRFAAMPKGQPHTRVEVGLAVLHRRVPDAQRFECFNDRNDAAVVDAACDERRLPGGSLVAAAGWCAPVEHDYSLCPPLSGVQGIIDLPAINVRRGGVSLTTFPDYQTIADAVTGQIMCGPDFTGKQCIEAPCVDDVVFTPCAVPLCVTNDILQERGYPEVIARFLGEVMTAQAHMVNAYIISKILAEVDDTITAANTVGGTASGAGAVHNVIDELSLLSEWYRDLYRADDSTTLEMVGPSWLPAALMADGRRRPDGGGVTSRAAVNGALNNVGVAPQWVRDWQPLAVGTGGPPAAYNPPVTWPSTVDILLYPAGTFAVGRADIINLNAVYDSAMLKNNKYTALFAEEMVTVVKRCYRALKVTIDISCLTGAMGPYKDFCAPVTP